MKFRIHLNDHRSNDEIGAFDENIKKTAIIMNVI